MYGKKYFNKKNNIILILILLLQNISLFFFDVVNRITSLQFVCLLLYIIYYITFEKNFKIRKFTLTWIAYCFVVLFNYFIGGDATFISFFFLINMLMLFELQTVDIGIIQLKIMTIFSYVHLFMSLAVWLLPHDTMNSVLRLVLQTNYNLNYSWRILSNVNAGMTTQPGVNAMYLGVLFLINMISFNNKRKYRNLIIALVSFAMIFTTAKRSVIFLSLITLIIFYLSTKNSINIKVNMNKVVNILLTFVIIILGIYYIYAKTNVLESFIEKLNVLSNINDISNGRFDLWNKSLLYFSNNPILGIGLKNFYIQESFDVHNTYLQILTETGMLGLMVFCVGLSQLFYKSLKSVRYVYLSKSNIEKKQAVGTGFCIMVFIIIYGFFGNSFIDYLPLMLFCTSIVMINGRYEEGK